MHFDCHRISDFSHTRLQQAYAQLSPSRKVYIDRLRRQEDKHRSLAAELLILDLLEKYYGITSATLHRKDSGEPYLTGCDLHISISHSDEMVAGVVSHVPVGIDIERIRPIKLSMCRHVCTPEETAYLQADTDPSERCQDPIILERFFEIWTAKEAYFKKCGTGITDLKSVNILTLSREVHKIEDYILQII